jgi:hypothetical protein
MGSLCVAALVSRGKHAIPTLRTGAHAMTLSGSRAGGPATAARDVCAPIPQPDRLATQPKASLMSDPGVALAPISLTGDRTIDRSPSAVRRLGWFGQVTLCLSNGEVGSPDSSDQAGLCDLCYNADGVSSPEGCIRSTPDISCGFARMHRGSPRAIAGVKTSVESRTTRPTGINRR